MVLKIEIFLPAYSLLWYSRLCICSPTDSTVSDDAEGTNPRLRWDFLAINTSFMNKKGSRYVPVWIHILLLKIDSFQITSTQEKLKLELKLTKGLCNKNVFKLQYTD